MGNFYTDVIYKDSRFNSVKLVNDVALLEPKTRQIVQEIIAASAAAGLPLMVFETFRSQVRQAELFEKHASMLKTVGVHHYGLACDLVKDVGGQPSWKGDFGFLGKLAHQHSIIWGGDWGAPGVHHGFVDSDHVQRITIKRQNALFAQTWYPDGDYDPYSDN